MNRVEEAYLKATSAADYAGKYITYLKEVLSSLNTDHIANFIQTLLDARQRGANIFFIGNGGSAATATHFANDLSIGTRSWTKPFKAISLSDNIAILTAIGNDYGYDEVFVQQLMAHMKKDDVVVAISASGNSPNIIKAIEYANQNGAITVGLCGFDGGKLKAISQLALHVPSQKGEYGPVEDVHMIFDHLVHGYLINYVKNEH